MTKDIKRILALLCLAYLLIGCAKNVQSQNRTVLVTPQVEVSAWDIYDSDPNHLWNRVFRQLYQRTVGEKEYGSNELDPLLWFDTTYMFTEPFYQQTIDVLDEFVNTNGETLINDPLKRAMFQRDMWAVFDWLITREWEYASQSLELQSRLSQIIKRVALSKEQILSLPNNYKQVVEAQIFPTDFQAEYPENAYLPVDLFEANSAWVPLGREDAPIVITHTTSSPFLGRSVFLIFIRTPNGRQGTLDFITSLQTQVQPITPIGTETALVRRMLLISNQGELVLSPLFEKIQIRRFNPDQTFYEFELNRNHFFKNIAGSFIPKKEIFSLFMNHGDEFENNRRPELKATIPNICLSCHYDYPSTAISGNTQSIISYSRHNFPLDENQTLNLLIGDWNSEFQKVIAWKITHKTWISLMSFWNQ
ncbi:MAG: hypothetical protein JNK81_03195 [Anaerolineales bacterium]|nr:hypothetical protein [Anaerolineales bacterium]